MNGKNNTISGYLGQEFQTKLIWQILIDPEFGSNIIKSIGAEYFDDPNLKRLIIIIKEYHIEFEKVPNLQNNSIELALNKFSNPSNVIEFETLKAVVERIKLLNDNVINNRIPFDGDVVQKESYNFIKQQEYRKLGEFILEKTKTGESKNLLNEFEEKINKISTIGDLQNNGISINENIESALSDQFRETIPTGITALDGVTGGGLGKGEIGIFLTPSGVGKTSILTKIANEAYEQGKKVLQIIFEDTTAQIQRKHFSIYSGVKLSQLDNNTDLVLTKVTNKLKALDIQGGKLIINSFSQENTTIQDIRQWIIKYQKIQGFKFDMIVLDYLDCLESNKKEKDRNESELSIVKSFLALSADFNIPCWSALQANRTAGGVEVIEMGNMGGSVKRYQKSHLFISINKEQDNRDTNLVNVKILKARFCEDGQTFRDSILDNDSLNIEFNDNEYKFKYSKLGEKHGIDKNIKKLKDSVIPDIPDPVIVPKFDSIVIPDPLVLVNPLIVPDAAIMAKKELDSIVIPDSVINVNMQCLKMLNSYVDPDEEIRKQSDELDILMNS